jgi:hypothetical protein
MQSPTVLLQQAFAIFQENIKLFFFIFIVPSVLSIALSHYAQQFDKDEPSLSLALMIPVLFLVLFVVNLCMGIAMIKAVASPEGLTAQSAYRFAFDNFLPYLWVAILMGVIVTIGFVLLIVPGIIFCVWFAFSYFVLLFEGKKGMDALQASKAYVKGRWWPIFGRLAFILVIAIILSMILGIIFGISAENQNSLASLLATQLLNFVLIPVSIAYTYLLYKEVKTIPVGVISNVQTHEQSTETQTESTEPKE